MSTTYVLLPSPSPTGNNDNGPDASSDAFTDDVPRTTVTITSFYTAESTSATSSSGSNANSSTSPGSRKFAALAVGGALGGFALTCLIGWAMIWWWRKRWLARRTAGIDGEGGSAPVLGIGALRTDAENFPGWRRTVASRLQETDRRSQTTATDVNERRSSSFAPPSLGGHLLTHMEEARPNFVTRPPGARAPVLPLPLSASSDLTRECTRAFSRVGRSRGSVSSKSSSSVGGVDKSPRSPPLGTSSLAFLQEQRSEEDGSGTHGHTAVAEGAGAPGLTNASVQKVNDLASQDSHSSSQFYSPSAATHPPPATYHAGQPHFYHPGNPVLPPGPARTPSPTQHRRNSASSQASAGGFGASSPSSWHGHTSTPQRHGHASWHGPSLATMHWSGHLPHFGRGDGGAAAGSSAAGAGGPPSSWFHPSHHHARSFSGSGLSVPSSQRPLLSNHTSNGTGSSGSAPVPPPNAWTPPQPKFFFQPPSAAGSRAPSPPPSPPPSPLDPPPPGRRLTVTNPDLNSSPATSSVNLPEDEKSPTKPAGSATLGKSPLSQ
ncbi:hypothetical protein FRC01_009095 [Tulasnella sp. 417]|nr:hypothetical protein FRC01_009095 [Tulasnella sp. 417]